MDFNGFMYSDILFLENKIKITKIHIKDTGETVKSFELGELTRDQQALKVNL